MRALQSSTEDASDTIRELVSQHDRNTEIIAKAGRSVKTLFAYLEQNPIIDIGKTAKETGLAFSTVSLAAKRLTEKGILIQTNNSNRNRVFAYEEYLNILRKDT